MDHATSPGAIAPRRASSPFWLVNSWVWSAYAGALMLPWIGRYSILDMLPNKVTIAITGIAVTAGLRAFYKWMDRHAVSQPRQLAAALAACVVGAISLDVVVVAVTQGPSAILQLWDSSLGSLLGGVPMPGRIGQYAILLVAWSLGLNLFDRPRTASVSPGAPDASSPGSDTTLAVAGKTVRARDGQRTILLDRDEIDWIAADGDYVRIHTGAKSFLIRATMKSAAHTFAPSGFIRVHRSAIVNPRRVREIVREAGGDQSVVLKTGARVKAGRNYAPSLDALLLPIDVSAEGRVE